MLPRPPPRGLRCLLLLLAALLIALSAASVPAAASHQVLLEQSLIPCPIGCSPSECPDDLWACLCPPLCSTAGTDEDWAMVIELPESPCPLPLCMGACPWDLADCICPPLCNAFRLVAQE